MSVTVVWGNNHFINCVALLSWKDELVLSVTTGPLRVDLKTPAGGAFKLEIVANRVIEPPFDKIRITPTSSSVAIVLDDKPLLMAHEVGDGRVLLHTDLRPIGMNIFSDAGGLHIGANTLAGNLFEGLSTAISLG